MLLRLAVAAAATVTLVSAQSWEIAPVSGFLKLSRKVIGSANLDAPKDDDTKLTGHQPVYGMRATWNSKGYWGLEATYLRSKARIDSKLITISSSTNTDTVLESGRITLNQVFFNGISYFMPRGERFRPYVTAGFQVQQYSTPPLPDWIFDNSRRLGFNYGGGLKIQMSKGVLIRFDVRDIWGGSPYDLQFDTSTGNELRKPGMFRQVEGTLGIGFRF